MNDLYINVSQSDELEWVRPSEWLPMPEMIEGEQKVAGLYAVWGGGSDFCAMLCEGNYHVNWGDGVEEDVASGVKAQHIFNYNALAGTETSEGFRQAIVVITPQAGENLTIIHFEQSDEVITQYAFVELIELEVVGEYIQGMDMGSNNNIKAFKQIGDWPYMNFSNMFSYCNSLKKIWALNTANAIYFDSVFNNSSLRKLTSLNLPNAVTLYGLFVDCIHLEEIEIIAPACVNFDSLCAHSEYLEKVNIYSSGINKTFASAFAYCCKLKHFDGQNFNFQNANQLSYLFLNCINLKHIKNITIVDGCITTGIFESCPLLSVVENCSFAESISFEYCLLSAEMLENIFNQLEVATGKVITITGNWGVPYLTQAQKDIAINKGWTIVE